MQLFLISTLFINSVQAKVCHGWGCCPDSATLTDNLPYCKELERQGVCGGCREFQTKTVGYSMFCCEKLHRALESDDSPEPEQKPVVEAPKPVEEAPKPELTAAKAVCHGWDCCPDSATLIDNLPYCKELERQGKCGGCREFQVKTVGHSIFCCKKLHKALNSDDSPEQEQKPVVEAPKPVEEAPKPEQKAAVKEANDICHGEQCCDGNHDQWIDNLPYCQQLEREGKCGGCFKFQVDPSPDTLFCCRKHYKDDAPKEQQTPVEEAPKPEQKPVVEAPKSEEKAAIQEANDICHGVQCCDGNHDQWIDNLPYCQQLEREGTCGGCFKFQVDPNPETLFCCRKHYKTPVMV